MAILKVKDKNGNIQEIPAIIGPQGPQGIPGPTGAPGTPGRDGRDGWNGDHIQDISCYDGELSVTTYSDNYGWNWYSTSINGLPRSWYINDSGNLIRVDSDWSEHNLGKVMGTDGANGSVWRSTSSSFDKTNDTPVTINYTEIGSGAGVPDTSSLNLFAILNCNLTIGAQYKVEFDGDIYDCICFAASTGSPALGSESLISRSITYPFFVIQEYEGTFCAASDIENSHTITIYEPSENSLVGIGVAEVNDLIFSTTTNDLYQVQNKRIDYYESDSKKKIDIIIDLNWLSLLKGSNGLSVKSATAQYVNENSVPTLKFTFTISDDSTLPVNVDLTQFKQEIIDEINAQYVNVSEVEQ